MTKRSAETVWLWPFILAAGLLAYSNSFRGEFVFDDDATIFENPNIRSLRPITQTIQAPPDSPAAGRPVVALSLALNYALNGFNPAGYHLWNLAVHLLAGLLLFGIVRRTLLAPRFEGRFDAISQELAAFVAALWLVHPIQTESVTYIVQRAESMMGLFYLLTLYAFIRGAGVGSSRTKWAWFAVAIAACMLGMATKEVMVTCPVIVLIYDWLFTRSSLKNTLRGRGGFYAGLAATWLILAAILATGPRAKTTGLGLGEITPWAYARTQFAVILHYLRLSVWPRGLCIDYGWPVAKTLVQIVPPMLAIAALAGITIWALIRRSPWALPGIWFLLILSPTSSVVPIKDLAFEHRMYLPLAGVVAAVVIGGWMLLQRIFSPPPEITPFRVVFVAALLALGSATFQRNKVYHSKTALWQDVVAKQPNNARGRNNLAACYLSDDSLGDRRLDLAIAQCAESLELDAASAEAEATMGDALRMKGDLDAAMEHYRKALALRENYAGVYNSIGLIHHTRGESELAAAAWRTAIKHNRQDHMAFNNLGNYLLAAGQFEQAAIHYQAALMIRPDYAAARNGLEMATQHRRELDPAERLNEEAIVLARAGRAAEAVEKWRAALTHRPDFTGVYNNLGMGLIALGRRDEAMEAFRRALQLDPSLLQARINLSGELRKQGRPDEAIAVCREGVAAAPANADMRLILASELDAQGRREEAVATYGEVLRLRPNDVEVKKRLQILTGADDAPASR